jgi:urea carboxylase
MWNTHRTTREFTPGTPWLLRFFDQIRFFPVTAPELLEIRGAFLYGQYPLNIEQTDFNLKRYHEFLAKTSSEAARFKKHQHEAFVAERERWAAAGQLEFTDPSSEEMPRIAADLPDGYEAVRSPMTASVWHVAVEPGQRVGAGQRVFVLEAMKMEFVVVAPSNGIVEGVHCARGGMVMAGQNLATLRVHG